MSIEEAIQKLFIAPLEKHVWLYEDEIHEALARNTSHAVIDVREIDIQDISKKVKDSTYLNDEYVQYTDKGIKILETSPKIVEIIKKHIPRDVEELSIPSGFLSDLEFLQEFPNLKTIHITDYSTLTKEQVEYIANNTKVDYMTFRSTGTLNGLKCVEGTNIIDAGNMIGQYGKLTMFTSGYQNKWRSNIKVYTSNFDKRNLAILGGLFDGIKPHIEKIEDVSLTTTETYSMNTEFEFTVENNKVSKMHIKGVSPTVAALVYRSMKKRNTEVESTRISLENKTYDDIYQLKQMDDTSKCTVRYSKGDSSADSTYEEFLNMRGTIDYYKELIEQSNLSPVEQVAYVYDILKTMRYQENNEDKQRSRNIHAIVTDGTIVCVGYAAFAKQLLSELGIKCLNVGVTCKAEEGPDGGHARNIVKVDDDKYNIHGLFAMDITWDSDKDIAIVEENGEKTIVSRPNEELKKKVVDKYDSLILYRHFLIPMETYEERYPEEINPTIYEAYKNGHAKELVEDSRLVAKGHKKRLEVKNLYALSQHEELFDYEDGPLVVERYFEAPKPSLETFREILTSVRTAQGYSKEDTKEEVDRVVELHEMLNNQNPNSPNHFFKPSTK